MKVGIKSASQIDSRRAVLSGTSWGGEESYEDESRLWWPLDKEVYLDKHQ